MKINSFDNPQLYKLYLMLTEPDTHLINLDYSFSKEFDSLRDFIREIQNLLDGQAEAIQTKMEEEEKKYENDQRSLESVYSFFGDDLYKYGFLYKKLLMNTTFVSTVSMFEVALKKTCTVHYSEFSKTVEDVPAKGGNISRYRMYLERIVGLNLQPLEKLWGLIKDYNEVRNLILHEYSDASKGQTRPLGQNKTYQFLSKSPYIELDNKNSGIFYIRDQQFILDFIDVGEFYLTEVFKILRTERTKKEGKEK